MKKRMFSIVLTAVTVFVTAGLVSGCGGSTEETSSYDATADSPGTLTFTVKDAEQGFISGTFESEDGYTIRFDVARGEENPWFERLAAGAPSHGIDVRICDEKHFCFSQQAGGHAFADPTWVEDNSEANGPDDARARKNQEVKKELRQKLEDVDAGEFRGLKEEYQALFDATGNGGTEWEPPPQPNTSSSESSESESPQKGVSALKVAATGSYTQQHWMRKVGILFGSVVGDHSASYVRVLTSAGSLYSEYWTCNHGTCGNSSSMNNYCIRNYTGRSATIPINTRCMVPASPGTMHPTGYDGCCLTQYNFTGISHVCNDDTRLQRDFMIAGAPMNTLYCQDTVLAQYAPSCI